MTGLVRKATLLLGVCGVLAASSALGDVPSCSNSGVTPGVYPAFIKVVQLNNSGQAHVTCDITLTIRDGLGNLLNAARVSLDFSACCDINICSSYTPSPNPYFQEVKQCNPPVISARTDPGGVVKFKIVGAAKNPGTTVQPAIFPGAGFDCIKILLGAVGSETLCDSATAVAYDQNGATNLVETPVVNAADQAILSNDVGAIVLFNRGYMGRDDYDQTGAINAADQAGLSFQVFRASVAGDGSGSINACPGRTYCKVKVNTPNCTRQNNP